MARPTQDAIDTFMRITGASESHALRKLEEHGGNLDEAVNADFSEVERTIPNTVPGVSPLHDFAHPRNQMQASPRGILPLLSAARSFKPSSLLDPNYRRKFWNQIGASVFPSHEPLYPHAGEFNNGYERPYHSGPRPAFAETDQISLSHGHQFNGNVSGDHEAHLNGSDIEEQMIQFAIEASKQEDASGAPQRQLNLENDDLAHAISLSLKTAEQENAVRKQTVEDQKQLVDHNSIGRSEKNKDGRWQAGSSSFQGEAENLQEQSLWGGISSKELDEAILLETALFGEAPEGPSSQHSSHLQSAQNKTVYPQQVANHQSLSHQESETSLASKEASLSQEPAVNDENAITLLIRMPDGSRHGRRFLKSDKLQFLFDFIDFGKTVKPGTYRVLSTCRVVREYGERPKLFFTSIDNHYSNAIYQGKYLN